MSLYVLDTDHVTLHQHNHPQVVAGIRARTPDQLAVTVVSLEEQMRGRLAQITRPKVDLTIPYDQLRATVAYFCDLNILPFDTAAEQQYLQLRSQKIRIGTLDLRIASIILTQDAVLVTRNRRHFEQVPGLRLEDWSEG